MIDTRIFFLVALVAMQTNSSLNPAAAELLEKRQYLTTLYVDTNSAVASDSNAGTSINSPLKTIDRALVLSQNNNSGTQSDTVFIRGGVYREQPNVLLANSGASATNRTIISAYVDPATSTYEPVYIDAADPTTGGWVRDANSNRWFLSNFRTQTAGVWVDWSGENDGASLQQIGGYAGETSSSRKIVGSGVADMYAGSYFADVLTSRLYIWLSDSSDPNAHAIEYANRARAFYQPGSGNGPVYTYASHIDFKGLRLRHENVYNPVGQDSGCAIYTANDQRLIDCDIQWNTGEGVYLRNTSQMINCTASNNGGNGVAGQGSGFLISGGHYNFNFWRQYNNGSAAGIKVISNVPTLYGNIQGVEAANNFGKGIWFDTCFENSVVSQVMGNYIHDNQGEGISLEASRNYILANNVITDNQGGGITINATENVQVYNNTLVGNNGIATIELDGGTRDQGAVFPGTVGTLNVSVRNNIIANNFSVYDLDIPTKAAPSRYINNNSADYNLFYRRGGPLHFTTGGSYLGWGSTPSTLASWRSASGQDSHSIVADPLFSSDGTAANAFLIGSDSPARDSGTTLASITTDYAQTARPQFGTYDTGAFEYSSGGVGSAGPVVNNTDSAVWVDDQLPSNAAMTPPDQSGNTLQSRFWIWNSGIQYSGTVALDSTAAIGLHRQYFTNADPRTVAANDLMFAYVWIDPAALPRQIALEWQDTKGSWNHLAYWGQNLVPAALDGSTNFHRVGDLPASGTWVRLEVPAATVGLAGVKISGFCFTLYDGRALLDKVGNAPPTVATTSSLGGFIYQDNNGDGILNTNETGLVNVPVFLDIYNDGTLDPNDPSTFSDASGAFSFTNILPGNYVVRAVVPTGFIASTVGGESSTVAIINGNAVLQNFGFFPTEFTARGDFNSYAIGLSSDQTTIQIWRNAPESSPATYSILATQLPQFHLSARDTYTSLVVDTSNGSPLPSDAIVFDGGTSLGALSIIGFLGQSNSFVLDSGAVAVNGTSIDYSNVGQIHIDGGSGDDILYQYEQTAQVVFAGGLGNDMLNVLAGTFTFSADPQLLTSNLTVNAGYGASIVFGPKTSGTGNTAYHLAELYLGYGSAAIVATTNSPSDRSILVTGNLSDFGTLDLCNNDMVVTSGDFYTVALLLSSGFDSGYWDGSNGILSSAAHSDATFISALGWTIGESMLVDGQTVIPTDVLVRYTYYGDTNLDGVVDASDYSKIDNAALSPATGWNNGDFNYDSVVDGSDYSLIDNAFNTQPFSVAASLKSTTYLTVDPAIWGSNSRLLVTDATQTLGTHLTSSLRTVHSYVFGSQDSDKSKSFTALEIADFKIVVPTKVPAHVHLLTTMLRPIFRMRRSDFESASINSELA